MTKPDSIERFYWNVPDDILAITHGEDGRLAMELIPEGIQSLAGTDIRSVVAIMMKIRDVTGQVVGIGSELEYFPAKGYLQVYFTIVVPSRGMICAYEEKDYNAPRLQELFDEAAKSQREWRGEFTNISTCGPSPNKRGIVIAGTGEFEGFTGEMLQIQNFRRMPAKRLAPPTVYNCETFWLTAQG